MDFLTQIDAALCQRRQADAVLVDLLVARSHAPNPDDAAALLDVVERRGLDLVAIKGRIAGHVGKVARAEQLAAAVGRIGSLAGEIRQREGFAALLDRVTVEQVRACAEAGIAKTAGNEGVADWLRSRGWKLRGSGGWRDTVGVERLQYEALATQWAADSDPVRGPLGQHVATRATAGTPPVDSAKDNPDALAETMAELHRKLAALPDPDPDALKWVNAASAVLAANGSEDDQTAWLLSCGWTRVPVENLLVWTNPRGMRFTITPARPVEAHLRESVDPVRREALDHLRRTAHATITAAAVAIAGG